MKARYFIIGLLLITSISEGVGIYHVYKYKKASEKPEISVYTEKVDTTYGIDTTFVNEPEISKEKPIETIYITLWKTEMDSSVIRQRDSLLNELGIALKERDSLELVLHRVQRTYKTQEYQAWVSGVDPQLDSIWVFATTKYITKNLVQTEKYKPKFTFGLQAGVGIIIPFNSGIPNAGGYLGAGVQYNF